MLLLGVGWGLALLFRSPAQIAASTSAPTKKPVTATITRGELSDTLTFGAKIGRQESADLKIRGDNGVITGLVYHLGNSVSSGSKIATVNDKPIIICKTNIPFYRDIKIGDTGPDVGRLQQCLQDSGYAISPEQHPSVGSYTAGLARDLFEVPVRTGTPPAAAGTNDSDKTNPDNSSGSDNADAQVIMPLSQVLTTPALPGILLAQPDLGAVLGGDKPPAFAVGSEQLQTHAQVPGATAAKLSAGAEVTLINKGKSIIGHVSFLPKALQPTDKDKDQATLEVRIDAKFPADWADQNVVVKSVTAKLSADALLVPTRALSRDANAKITIQVVDAQTVTSIEVVVLGEIAGTAAVYSTNPAVKAGAKVVVR